jgi:hypothetical protein
LINWWKDKLENPLSERDLPHPSAARPSLSDQEDDQIIKSWLCFPSDSNQDKAILVGADWNDKHTMVGSNDEKRVMMPDATEAVTSSASIEKRNDRNDTALMSEVKAGTSHAARTKKKAKEKVGLKSRSQVRSP